MHRLSLTLLTIICTAAVAQAQDAPPADTLACSGPFARDSSHAKLISAFGPKNVTFEDVDGAEGSREKASVLFANEPTRRVQIFWHDERTRAKPSTITIATPSQWVGPAGITIGMTAAQVEKLNGKPFQINGFGWDGGGYANKLDGKLANVPGGCTLSLRFEPTAANPLPDRYAPIIGDKKVASSNALMRRAKPMIGQWSVGYPQ
jgi:hypothetical protein